MGKDEEEVQLRRAQEWERGERDRCLSKVVVDGGEVDAGLFWQSRLVG
jgi:hypothetical protein